MPQSKKMLVAQEKLSHREVRVLVRELCAKLAHNKTSHPIKLYPVPRGGVPVAYLMLGEDPLFCIVDEAVHADIIIDDIIDSGATKNRFAREYQHVPFHALIDKSDKTSRFADKWVYFPWEKETTRSSDDSVAGTIRSRILAANAPFAANDNIASFIQPNEMSILEDEVTRRAEAFLQGLVIDTQTDHNTCGSARRIARMYLKEVFKGRYMPAPVITDFPNAKKLDEMYATGPITIRSGCSHHFVPIMGKCWVGVIPGERVIGLSKFNRIIDWIASRPQIQEELAVQIADYLEEQIKPKGLAVVIEATHMCMTWRGVREPVEAQMVNSVMRGAFQKNPAAKTEFMTLIKR